MRMSEQLVECSVFKVFKAVSNCFQGLPYICCDILRQISEVTINAESHLEKMQSQQRLRRSLIDFLLGAQDGQGSIFINFLLISY